MAQLWKWITAALLILSLACATFYNAFRAYDFKLRELSVIHAFEVNRSEATIENSLPVHPVNRSRRKKDPTESSFSVSMAYCFGFFFAFAGVTGFTAFHFFCSKRHEERLEKRAQRQFQEELQRTEEIRLQEIREKAEFAAMQLASVYIIYRPRTPREDEDTEL